MTREFQENSLVKKDIASELDNILEDRLQEKDFSAIDNESFESLIALSKNELNKS